MNWKRIITFAAILFVATAAAAFPFGFLRGFLNAVGHSPSSWLPFAQGVAVWLAGICVFAAFAKRQTLQVWQHGFVLVAVTWLVSYPINVLLLGTTLIAWAESLVVLLIPLAIGIPIGRRLAAEGKAAAEPAVEGDAP